MAVSFGNLPVIRRGKEVFYCFSEARRTLFSSIAEENLKNAMQYIAIETLMCNEEENTFFQKYLPSQSCPFTLISEQNLSRLHRFILDSSQTEGNMQNFGYKFPFATNNITSSVLPGNSPFMPWPFQSRFGEAKKDNHANSSFSNDTNNCNFYCEPKTKADKIENLVFSSGSAEFLTEQLADISSNCSPQPISEIMSEEASLSTDASDEKSKTAATLNEEEMSPKLRSDLCKIRKFYSVELNFDRAGCALQTSTIEKMIERCCRFLWFLKNIKKVEPELTYCVNPQVVQEFVHYMMDKRSVKAVTCSRYITAFINVLKVPACSDSNASAGKQDLTDSMERIRAIQRQLERLSKQGRVDELAKMPQVQKVVYPELLEICRELKWHVSEQQGIAQARSCMNLCLVLLYCTANPGRAKEYITLRIYKNQSGDECKNQNFICFNDDETVVLFEDAYKTRPIYGPNRTELTTLTFLTYYLKLYFTKMRPLLLAGKEHDFFFVNNRGDAFTKNTYGGYISALFENYFSVKLTTRDIRKAVVNHFLSLPQSSDLSLRESFATLMKHSVRTQKRYYDERPLAQKKSRALDMLSSMASRTLEEDEVRIISDEDEVGNIEYLPLPGDFVALVAANSSKIKPEVFVAKVLRLSEDNKTAFLAEFSETDPGKFRLNAGKSYKEAVNALVYPVDIAYIHSNGVYELRTPKIDIHCQVYKQ